MVITMEITRVITMVIRLAVDAVDLHGRPAVDRHDSNHVLHGLLALDILGSVLLSPSVLLLLLPGQSLTALPDQGISWQKQEKILLLH